jgi:very-short-patch-repair endonuclease
MVGASTEKKRDALAINRDRAKQMRHTPVSTEKLFWSEIRNRKLGGFKFKRQVPLGPYIVDFVCLDENLVVELDGPLHNDRTQYDANRDALLRQLGYRVLRFANDDVGGDFAGVLATILHALRGGAPSP